MLQFESARDPGLTLELAQRTSQGVLEELERLYPNPRDVVLQNRQTLVQFARDNDTDRRPPGDWEIMIPFRLGDGTVDDGLRVHVAPKPLLASSGKPANDYVLGIELLDYDDFIKRPPRVSTGCSIGRGLGFFVNDTYENERVGGSSGALLRYNMNLTTNPPPYLGAPIQFSGEVDDDERFTLFMRPTYAKDRLIDFIKHLVLASRPLEILREAYADWEAPKWRAYNHGDDMNM
jgi:hypothetical protein